MQEKYENKAKLIFFVGKEVLKLQVSKLILRLTMLFGIVGKIIRIIGEIIRIIDEVIRAILLTRVPVSRLAIKAKNRKRTQGVPCPSLITDI